MPEIKNHLARPGATIVAVGTNVLRKVFDFEPFVRATEKALGVPIRVISGRRESELAIRGGAFGLE
jgi:exopolyphosphatase/pppGpp-phosphohydrolase